MNNSTHNFGSLHSTSTFVLIAALSILPWRKSIGQADGGLDPSFGVSGIVNTGLGTTNDAAFALAVQTDGKIVSAGLAGVIAIPFVNDFGAVRYNTDGSLDSGFGSNGMVTIPVGSGDDQARTLVIQPNDGKIIVAGSAMIGGNWDLALVRYLPNGFLDNTFGINGRVTRSIGNGDDLGFAMALQPDGKILVGGHSVLQGTVQMTIVRFNTNGIIDSGFGQGGQVILNFGTSTAIVHSLIVQPDLKILVGGYAGNTSSKDFALIRLFSNGTLDTAFGSGGGTLTSISIGDDLAYGMALHPDGRIVLCGKTQSGTGDDMAIIQYTSTGGLDESFGNNGVIIYNGGFGNDVAWAAAIQADSRTVITGSISATSTVQHALLRITADGTLDPTFGANGVALYTDPLGSSYAHAVVVHSAGYILTAGGTFNGSNADFLLTKHVNGPAADPPNAGSNANLAICSNDPPTSLFNALQGEPDTGGSWNGPSATTGTYDPASMVPGNYIYTVSGGGIYPDASATVVVQEQQAPYAGVDGAVEVCYNSSPFILISVLEDNPNPNGVWSYSSMIMSGVFIPSVDPEGVYTYMAPGVGSCANDTSEVLVNIIDLGLAGIDGPETIPEVGTLTYTATPTLPDAETYSWSIPSGWSWDDADPADGVAYLVPPEEAGLYSICATASGGGCDGNEVCFATEVTVSVSEGDGSNPHGLVIFPNPNNGLFTLDLHSGTSPIEVLIIDALGRTLPAPPFQREGRVLRFDLQGLAGGTYIVRVQLAGHVTTVPLCIVR